MTGKSLYEYIEKQKINFRTERINGGNRLQEKLFIRGNLNGKYVRGCKRVYKDIL